MYIRDKIVEAWGLFRKFWNVIRWFIAAALVVLGCVGIWYLSMWFLDMDHASHDPNQLGEQTREFTWIIGTFFLIGCTILGFFMSLWKRK